MSDTNAERIQREYGFSGAIGDYPISKEEVDKKRAPLKAEIVPARRWLQKVLLILVVALFFSGIAVALMVLASLYGRITGDVIVATEIERMVALPAAGVMSIALGFIFVFSKRIKNLDRKYHAVKMFDHVGVAIYPIISGNKDHLEVGPGYNDQLLALVTMIERDDAVRSYLEQVERRGRLLLTGEFIMLAEHFLKALSPYIDVDLHDIRMPERKADRLALVINSNSEKDLEK